MNSQSELNDRTGGQPNANLLRRVMAIMRANYRDVGGAIGLSTSKISAETHAPTGDTHAAVIFLIAAGRIEPVPGIVGQFRLSSWARADLVRADPPASFVNFDDILAALGREFQSAVKCGGEVLRGITPDALAQSLHVRPNVIGSALAEMSRQASVESTDDGLGVRLSGPRREAILRAMQFVSDVQPAAPVVTNHPALACLDDAIVALKDAMRRANSARAAIELGDESAKVYLRIVACHLAVAVDMTTAATSGLSE